MISKKLQKIKNIYYISTVFNVPEEYYIITV
jgi:hypothetical protein